MVFKDGIGIRQLLYEKLHVAVVASCIVKILTRCRTIKTTMNKKTISLAFAALMLFGCETIEVGEGDMSDEGNQNTSQLNALAVKTRGVVTFDDGESSSTEKISYPVYIYAFDSKNRCVDIKEISGEDTPIEFSLIKGAYNICAIGTDAGGHYTVPSRDYCTIATAVSLKNGFDHADLMSSTASVVVEEGESNTLTMQMDRKVLRVDDISMSGIPDDVTGVSVTISPLGENLLLNGELSGKNGYKSVSLAKDEEAEAWTNEESFYLLASGSKATVKVALTYNDGHTDAYTYTSEETLEKNYIVNISGVFKAKEIILSGTLKGVDWAGTKNISFLMKEEDGGTETIPAVGTIYNGCYVLRHYKEGQNTTVVTLMSLDEKTDLVFEEDENQLSLSAAIVKGLESLSKGKMKLRMPDLQERRYLASHVEEINKDLERLKATPISLNQVNSDGSPKDRVGYYFRRTTNGKVSLFFVKSNKTDPDDEILPSESRYCHLRGFATITF